MAKSISLLTALLMILVAACSPAAPPPQAVASTPARDLLLNYNAQQPTPVPQEIIDAADAEYLLLSNIYDRVTPSVVNIEVTLSEDTASILIPTGSGSGFVYDTEGHIVT
ncbi:MAG: serine protease, partial [Chloroflexi bacterium]